MYMIDNNVHVAFACIAFSMQRYLALDDRVAWAYFEFTEELLSGETIEEWITLNGKQGDGQEGTMNVILSFTVGAFYL